MRRWQATLALLSLSLVAWNGSGDGVVTWRSGGQRLSLPIEAVGRVDPGDQVQLVITFTPPSQGGDAVLTVKYEDWLRSEGIIDLPSYYMNLSYREYDEDGYTRFRATSMTGQFRAGSDGRRDLSMSVAFLDAAHPNESRTLENLELVIDPVDAEDERDEDMSGSGVVVADDDGCDDNTYNDDYDEDYDHGYYDDTNDSSGCEGEDNSSDDSGGCEDDASSTSSTDSSSGCEGDSVDGGSDGCDCEGDAVARAQGRKRSKVLYKALNYLPYLMVFGFIRLLRRRRRPPMT